MNCSDCDSDSKSSECKCNSPSSSSGDSICCQGSKVKKPMSLMSLTSALNLRRGKTLILNPRKTRKCNRHIPDTQQSFTTHYTCNAKKPPKWVLKFNCTKKDRCDDKLNGKKCCTCSCYHSVDEQIKSAEDPSMGVESTSKLSEQDFGAVYKVQTACVNVSVPPGEDDCDEQARIQRAKEMDEGVAPPTSFKTARRVQVLCSESSMSHLDNRAVVHHLQVVCPPDLPMDSLKALFQTNVTVRACHLGAPFPGCHTQVGYLHCLVPDLLAITNSPFYWGKMDRYEAERLLDGRPEGSFLLRDSSQEEYLFSVSFRRYGRSLHARIEQWNHKFSFDVHDPGVFSSNTVCGLLEHYKDPSSCMFFEPALTLPLHRNYTFSLQHLCRAVITSRLTYDDIGQLNLPKTLKTYLKEYHYRQKVKVEHFDDDIQGVVFKEPVSDSTA